MVDDGRLDAVCRLMRRRITQIGGRDAQLATHTLLVASKCYQYGPFRFRESRDDVTEDNRNVCTSISSQPRLTKYWDLPCSWHKLPWKESPSRRRQLILPNTRVGVGKFIKGYNHVDHGNGEIAWS